MTAAPPASAWRPVRQARRPAWLPSPAWRPSAALIRASAFAVLAAGLALGLGRADLAVLVSPVVLLLVLGLVAARGTDPQRASLRARLVGAPQAGQLADVVITGTGTDQAQLVTAVAPEGAGRPAGGWLSLAGAQASARRTLRLPSWGRAVLAQPDFELMGPDGLLEYGPVGADALSVDVLPGRRPAERSDLPPIWGGWAGEHVSRRPGQGGDLIDLREYQPGDRLRSVHWRAFARQQRLFVRRTRSDADAEFVLCLDTRDQIRPQPYPPRSTWEDVRRRWQKRLEEWLAALAGLFRLPGPLPERDAPPSSSLDHTVDAAVAIAAAQLKVGDRVGLLDLGRRRRHLVMGSGSRHLDRIRFQLSNLQLTPTRQLVRASAWGLPSASVVVVLSALADAVIVTAAVDAHAAGHRVIVIDTLPERGLLAMAEPDQVRVTEIGLLTAERDARLHLLRVAGIPVVRWEDGHLGAELAAWRRAGRNRR